MPSLRSLISGTCQLTVLGGIVAAVQYRRTCTNISCDSQGVSRSFSRYNRTTDREMYDVAVIGGGIVGVATARELRCRFPSMSVVLLEKEADVAQHQSGHNSGCIHAGMYYPPGTSMARLCPRGHDLMIDYCRREKLPYELCGKLIVGTKETDTSTIEQMFSYGVANGVKGLRILRGTAEIKLKEPAVEGVIALWSPYSGITDFANVTRHMFQQLCSSNKFAYQFQFEALDFVGVKTSSSSNTNYSEDLVLIRGREHGHRGPEKTVLARRVITCCGLDNDQVARSSGTVLSRIGDRIVQTYGFRGRYYQLVPERLGLVTRHVYPCPAPEDATGVSLGVHFTPTLDARRGRQLIIGPGCALAFARNGYSAYLVDLEYCLHCAFSKGGWVSLLSNFLSVAKMYNIDLNKRAFLRDAQRLIPSLRAEDIEHSFCGVMAYGVAQEGTVNFDLAMELVRPRVTLSAVRDAERVLIASGVVPAAVDGGADGNPLILNVRNAPSPAATACMSIAEDIVNTAEGSFGWKEGGLFKKNSYCMLAKQASSLFYSSA